MEHPLAGWSFLGETWPPYLNLWLNTTCVVLRSPSIALGILLGFALAQMKLIDCFEGHDFRQPLIAVQMLSPNFLSTKS